MAIRAGNDLKDVLTIGAKDFKAAVEKFMAKEINRITSPVPTPAPSAPTSSDPDDYKTPAKRRLDFS